MKKAQTFTIEELPRQFPEELYAAASFTLKFQYLESLNLIYIKPKPTEAAHKFFFNVRKVRLLSEGTTSLKIHL
jgi:hypothetical protein